MSRKDLLKNGQVYHIFTRSIADFKVFNGKEGISRILGLIQHYQVEQPSIRFSYFIRNKKTLGQQDSVVAVKEKENLVEIIAYCIMPTHLHLVLKQSKDEGISIYMSNILNGYTRYFNVKYGRKGPLWEGRFKNVLVTSDEQLLHLTRYVHLNPVTAGLVEKPDLWEASSYKEYLQDGQNSDHICSYRDVIDIKSDMYRPFVENRISYQRELGKIKNLLLE